MGCCSGTNESSCIEQTNRFECPVNHKSYRQVSQLTVLHNVARPWELSLEGRAYYFCDDPNCDVIYFDNLGSTITRSAVRTMIDIKVDTRKALICHCFGVSKQDYLETPIVKDFVVKQTKLKNCACEIKNPSGKCCLKDFPKI